MNKYRFEWNNRTAYVNADTWDLARAEFQKKFGFYPTPETTNQTQMMGESNGYN